MDFCFGTFRLQTAEKSRGWLEIRRFSDQMKFNRLGATYFWKIFRTNETYEKFSKNSNFFQNFFRKKIRFFFENFRIFRKIFVHFVRSKNFPEIGRAETIRLVQKSSNFELSSRFFGRLKTETKAHSLY